MNALLEQFVLEARELVNEASDELLALERLPGDQQRIDVAFRAFHTLKGGAAIADLPDMTQLLHVGEDLLSALRGRKVLGTPEMEARLFQAGFAVRVAGADAAWARVTNEIVMFRDIINQAGIKKMQ